MLQVETMSTWVNDFRYAIRVLLKHRSFSAMAVATLAIAIGANTAVFSVTRAVLLDPLPYVDASRLVMVWQDATQLGFPKNTPAAADYADWKSQNSVFNGLAALRPRSYNLTGTGEPQRLQAEQATHDLFSVLGVAPILGRSFGVEDDRSDSPKVVILSAALWKESFGAGPNVIGRSILLDGVPHEVIGVMPARFDFPWGFDSRIRETQIWTPIAFTSQELSNRDLHNLQVVGRLNPGVSLERAQQQMAAIARRLERDYPATNANTGVRVSPLREEIVGETKTAVLLLLAITGCVLLIASANLANLLLARSVGRRREIGVRIALGAGRARLIRQLFTENAILSLAGVFLGLLLADWSLQFLSLLVPENLTAAALVIDKRMLLFAFMLGVATTLLSGAVPARQAWRLGISEVLGQGSSRSGEQRSTHRMRTWLVVSQTAFTFVLLVAGGLMLRTFVHLHSLDPGFRGEHVLTLRTTLPLPRYRGVDARNEFYSRVLERIRELPGVVDAGFTSWIPYTNSGGSATFEIENRTLPAGVQHDANVRLVTPGYLPAMGMMLLGGRMLTRADRAGTEAVAVINRTMALKFWPGEDALNRRLRICPACPWLKIVGEVGDIHQQALDIEARPEYFVPFDQLTEALRFAAPQDMAIRVTGDAAALAPAARRAIWAIDPQQPVSQVRVLDDYLTQDLAPRRFQTGLTGAFAGIALLLASFGIYGVLSYTVSQRRREIGVRIALGADRSDVLQFIARQGMAPVLAGLMIGFIAAYGLAHLISGLLSGVQPHDPAAFGIATGVLAGTAFLACWIPARRAAGIDPGTVLRIE
jgi:putative ABC transport system permease protein